MFKSVIHSAATSFHFARDNMKKMLKVPVVKIPKWELSGGQFSGGTVVQEAIILGGNCPRENCPGGKCSRWHMPGGNCPGGNCPVPKRVIEKISLFMLSQKLICWMYRKQSSLLSTFTNVHFMKKFVQRLGTGGIFLKRLSNFFETESSSQSSYFCFSTLLKILRPFVWNVSSTCKQVWKLNPLIPVGNKKVTHA